MQPDDADITHADCEIRALARIQRVMDGLDHDARQRVLEYCWRRWVEGVKDEAVEAAGEADGVKP